MLFTSYMIKVSIALVIAYLFYFLFLRKITFYTVNRWYFLLMILLAFLFPLFDISVLLGSDTLSQPVVKIIPNLNLILPDDQIGSIEPTQTANQISSNFTISITLFLIGVYFFGCIYFLSRLIFQLLLLKRTMAGASFIRENRCSFYHVDLPIAPFSFFRRIYINMNRHSATELSEIFIHESTHIKQLHTIDNLMAEMLCIFCWFNPGAWMLKRAMKQNLEYLADQMTLESGCDPAHYQFHLLKVTGVQLTGITPGFTISFLKKRIIMINKIPSSKLHLTKLILILPLAFILMTAFQHPNESGIRADLFTDTIPASFAIKKQFPVNRVSNVADLPKDVTSIERQGSHTIVRYTSGHIETYDLSRTSDTNKFIQKFGKRPVVLENVSIGLNESNRTTKSKVIGPKRKDTIKKLKQVITGNESSKGAVVNIDPGIDDIHAIRMQGDKVMIDTIPGYIAKDKKLLKKWLKRYGY